MITTSSLVCYCRARREAEASDDPVLPPSILLFGGETADETARNARPRNLFTSTNQGSFVAQKSGKVVMKTKYHPEFKD